METDIHVLLSGGHKVSKAFLTEIQHQVAESVPAMEPQISYTTKMLCGNKFWVILNNRERRLVGRCLAHLVIHRLLPLQFVGPTRKYPKKYALREQ